MATTKTSSHWQKGEPHKNIVRETLRIRYTYISWASASSQTTACQLLSFTRMPSAAQALKIRKLKSIYWKIIYFFEKKIEVNEKLWRKSYEWEKQRENFPIWNGTCVLFIFPMNKDGKLILKIAHIDWFVSEYKLLQSSASFRVNDKQMLQILKNQFSISSHLMSVSSEQSFRS